ncbi:MAG: hypothetical protein ACI4I5_04235 [Acutalibacteraceae bacterium]
MNAKEFFSAFTAQMQESAVQDGKTYLDIYRNNAELTELVNRTVIPNIIKNAGYECIFEYYRVDCAGWLDRKGEIEAEAKALNIQAHLWDLMIAVEHENNKADWTDEIIKLMHLRCPLKVVIGYVPCDKREQDTEKLNTVAGWMRRLRAYDAQANEEFLIILGNAAAKDSQEEYKEFDYRGYLYNSITRKFQRV